MLVAGAGTGGTLSGIARKLREKCPNCIIIGVDPHGSILAQPESLNTAASSYKVEGIGYDFIPKVLDRSVVDKWYKSSDLESFTYSRRLIREEGILAGGSSGTAMWAAMIAAKDLKPGQNCVVLLADSVRNYMSKFLNDDWMATNGFLPGKATTSIDASSKKKIVKAPEQPIFNFGDHTIADLKLPNAVTVDAEALLSDAAKLMEKNNFDQVPVIDSAHGKHALVGLVTLGNILSKVAHGKAKLTDHVTKVMFKFDKSAGFRDISVNTKLAELTSFFDFHSSAVVTEGHVVKHVVTKTDLVSFMVKRM